MFLEKLFEKLFKPYWNLKKRAYRYGQKIGKKYNIPEKYDKLELDIKKRKEYLNKITEIPIVLFGLISDILALIIVLSLILFIFSPKKLIWKFIYLYVWAHIIGLIWEFIKERTKFIFNIDLDMEILKLISPKKYNQKLKNLNKNKKI